MVNQWKGWAVEPCPQRVMDEEVEPFTDYVRSIVCSGNDDHYEWVMAWLADIFQHPGEKPGTALVLVGVQGAGKTFLGEHVLGKIIGSGSTTHSLRTSLSLRTSSTPSSTTSVRPVRRGNPQLSAGRGVPA
jgi:hypothetical protein